MDEQQRKNIWNTLLKPFIVGLVILIVAILVHRFGSKKAGMQTISLFAGVFGFVFMAVSGLRLYRFKIYLKNNSQ